MSIKYLGYFMEDEVYFAGKKLPPQKCDVVSVDVGFRNFDEIAPEDTIHVLSAEGNWYTIKKKELVLVKEQ
jgi:hypothetical protein